MKSGLTEIIFILDRSGSMNTLKSDAIGGFNAFLKGQKEVPGEALFTLILFDDKYDQIITSTNIKDVPELNDSTFVPRGSTALLDAIGRTIDSVGERLSNTPEEERPEKVLFVILTDGQENASCKFDRDKIKEMIEHQQNVYNWAFIFLSSDLNAVQDSMSYGIHTGNTLLFKNTSEGYGQACYTMNASVKSYRKGIYNSQKIISDTDE